LIVHGKDNAPGLLWQVANAQLVGKQRWFENASSVKNRWSVTYCDTSRTKGCCSS